MWQYSRTLKWNASESRNNLLFKICMSCKKLDFFYYFFKAWHAVIFASLDWNFHLYLFFPCVFVQWAENLCDFRERQKARLVCWIHNYIFNCHTAVLSRVLWRSREADNVHLIKYSLLGWIQDCEIWTGSLNVFWESRNNLSVKLIHMNINQFGMFSNSSRKQSNGK